MKLRIAEYRDGDGEPFWRVERRVFFVWWMGLAAYHEPGFDGLVLSTDPVLSAVLDEPRNFATIDAAGAAIEQHRKWRAAKFPRRSVDTRRVKL